MFSYSIQEVHARCFPKVLYREYYTTLLAFIFEKEKKSLHALKYKLKYPTFNFSKLAEVNVSEIMTILYLENFIFKYIYVTKLMIHAILYPTSALQLSTLPIPPLGSLLDSLRQTIL